MAFSSLIILAFALSLDSFSAGLAYGLRAIRVPLKSVCIIGLCSAISLSIAMLFGQLLDSFLSPVAANRFGGTILILIGTLALYQVFRPERPLTDEKVLFKLEIRSVGVVINILKKPQQADFDQSGTITGLEAFVLGIALSLDSFGAGVGAAMLGFSPLLLALTVAVMCSLFLMIGLQSGRIFFGVKWIRKLSFLPGMILILIGILKF